MRNCSLFIFLLFVAACDKDSIDNRQTLRRLYKQYKEGEICECKYQTKTVYVAGINAYDAGSVIYDLNGKSIALCNYAWDQVDSICRHLSNCEVIYRCEDHISGQPPMDKYNLDK